jgi:hypothetical protein
MHLLSFVITSLSLEICPLMQFLLFFCVQIKNNSDPLSLLEYIVLRALLTYCHGPLVMRLVVKLYMLMAQDSYDSFSILAIFYSSQNGEVCECNLSFQTQDKIYHNKIGLQYIGVNSNNVAKIYTQKL